MGIAFKLVYRSKPIQYPLLAAIEACNGWERAGIDLQSVTFVSGAARSDPMLTNGECDFIFGSHISPYLHRFHGRPFVYLGQTANWVDELIVTREPVGSLKELEGKRFSEEPKVTAERHHGSHPGGNHLLYLRRGGVDTQRVTFVPSERRARYQDVLEGKADFAFAPTRDEAKMRTVGLQVLRLEPLPMVHASTMTTLWPTVVERPDLCLGVIKAVLMGVHFVKAQPERTWEIMQGDVAEELEIDDQARLKYLHEQNRSVLEARMYPMAEAVKNAFALAVMEEPEIEASLNPMSLWDLHLVRSLEESGFVDELYGGKVPGPGRPLGR